LQPGSPCTDAGDPFFVDEDETRADMGAYGGKGGALIDPGDIPPNTPANLSPVDGETGISPSPALTASPFFRSGYGRFSKRLPLAGQKRDWKLLPAHLR